MRVAIISDIHGNFVALGAALLDIEERNVDQVVCLGDVAATGPQPREVIKRLRSLECSYVMGNADEILAKNLAEEFEIQVPEPDRRRLGELDAWTRTQLTDPDRQFLLTFKPSVRIQLEGDLSLLCYHGTPSTNRQGILPTMNDNELAHHLEGFKADVFAGGHIHTQICRRFQSSIILNPGSIGLPFEAESSGKSRNPTKAEYAVLSISEKTLGIELLSVHYPLEDLMKSVRASTMPNPEWWSADWY